MSKLASVCVSVIIFTHNMNFDDLISIKNLFQAWDEFKKGKRKRKDVQLFERFLEDNLLDLYQILKSKTYHHGQYHAFYLQDPKRRHIHKATVSDRIIHHLLYKYLYELFDKSFIYDSYSCRLGKGTHKAVKRLTKFTRTVSKNYTIDCWALKLDIRLFFASVDHRVLIGLLSKKVNEEDILGLLKKVINSFGTCRGIPLGNLTSQIFANIYMNELDQFIKHKLKVKHYLRYADDFILVSRDKIMLEQQIVHIKEFLNNRLKLELHPKKIILRKLRWGIDFLGYVVLPQYILPRTKTKRRIFKKLREKIIELTIGDVSVYSFNQTLQAYLGFLKHASAYKITKQVKNEYA